MIRTIPANTIIYLENNIEILKLSQSGLQFPKPFNTEWADLIPPCFVYFSKEDTPDSWGRGNRSRVEKRDLLDYFSAPTTVAVWTLDDILIPDITEAEYEAAVEEICTSNKCSSCILNSCCQKMNDSERPALLKKAHKICAEWLVSNQKEEKKPMNKQNETLKTPASCNEETYSAAYECGKAEGMREVWSAVRRLHLGLDQKDIKNIFGKNETEIYETMSAEEVIETLNNFDQNRKLIKENDIVEYEEHFGVVLFANREKDEYLVWLFAELPIMTTSSQIKKTGKTLEIGKILALEER